MLLTRLNALMLVLALSLMAGDGLCEPSTQLIAHPGLSSERLEEEAVRALFTMRLRRWPDGTAVRVFVLPDRHPAHREFAKAVLGVFPHQLRRAWDRLVFTGTGQAPREVASEAEMIEQVAQVPGAVGYVSDQTKDERVRVIPVD